MAPRVAATRSSGLDLSDSSLIYCNGHQTPISVASNEKGRQFRAQDGMGGLQSTRINLIQHQLIMQGGGNRPPCKFGLNCRKMQSGTCNFYHPPNQGGQQTGGGGRGGFGGQQGGFQGGFTQPNFPQQQGNFGQQGGQQGGFNPNHGGGGWGGNRPPREQGGQGGPGGQGDSTYKGGKSGNDPFFSLCRNFHFNQPCQYGQNCKKKHYFIMNDQHAIRRFNFMRNIPSALQSKLSRFRSGGKDYFVLRNGNLINFFDFNFQTKALSDVFTWNLPQLPNGLKYNYYDHKGEYIYYSFPNPQTMLQDMALFHIPTQKIIHVGNSHSGRLTGMVHFNDQVLLTTSMAGQLKVWLRDGQTFIQQPQYTEKLRLYFNPQNLKLQLLFLDVSEVNGTKIIAAGTNDGRLLFFIGNDLAFQQVLFKGDAYSKVFGVKYASRPGNPPVPCALVLLWNTQQTLTSLLQVNLNTFEQTLLTQNQGTDSRTNICFFELVDQLLMVGTVGGDLSIYRFPDTTERIGAIMHQNAVTDIVFCEEELKNTGTKVKYMMVLERKTDKKEGSLGFYILK